MLSFVREGDTVFRYPMDRMARNLDDLRRITLQAEKCPAQEQRQGVSLEGERETGLRADAL